MGLFNSGSNTILLELSKILNGKFIKGFGASEVKVQHGELTIRISIGGGYQYSSPITTIDTSYVDKDGFCFKIYRESIFNKIGKLLGIKDVKVGFQKFDEDFVIKGNNEEKLKQLFKNSKIRKLLSHQQHVNLKLFRGRLSFIEYGTGKLMDVARLEQLCYLFIEILNQLYRIGSIDSKYKFDTIANKIKNYCSKCNRIRENNNEGKCPVCGNTLTTIE